MVLLLVALELYFSVMLIVSGLSKLADPKTFSIALVQQRILPLRAINYATKILPLVELLLAFLLIIGFAAPVTAVALLLLFFGFFGLKVFLLATGRTDCGCFSSHNRQQVDAASVVVALLLAILAAFHLWLVFHNDSVALLWRLVIGFLCIGGACFLLIRIFIKRQLSLPDDPYAGGLSVGEQAPLFTAFDQTGMPQNLSDYIGQRYILGFVLPGCTVCPGALKALHRLHQDEPDLAILIMGGADEARNRAYGQQHDVHLPFLTPDSQLVEQTYRVRGFPLLFVLDQTGVIRAKGVVNTYGHLQVLLRSAAKALPSGNVPSYLLSNKK
jgi:peroxiredoxin